ncbi:MAG: hypothetical protein IPG04_19955 [Polyangiaceae bacterium]|jgi:hypothetical protein|nr:hypothetical protein [Polyangiaceae bacterium]
MGKATLLLITLLCCSACNVSTTRRKPIVEPEQAAHRGTTRTSVQYAHANDAPEISRGTGDAGTVVVLWPRVLPKTDDPKISDLAGRVQIRLDRLAAKTGKKVDRRPAPERVCPKDAGCKGVSLGAILAVKEQGCAVVALVGPSGTQPVTLVPLAGDAKLSATTSPFREPPENLVTVSEFVPCDKLLQDLETNVILEGEANVSKVLGDAEAAGK